MKTVSAYLLGVMCLLSAGLFSCSNGDKSAEAKAMRNLYWVEGEWKGRVKGGMMFERWVMEEDSSMTGFSCIISHSDTVFREYMKIEERDGDIFYVVNVRHNDGPVAFKFIECTSKGCIFENLEHDYPTRIVYANTIGDMLLARIEGMRGNRPDTSRFFMHRNEMFTE